MATLLTEPPGEPHGNVMHRTGADVLTIQPDPGRHDLLGPFAAVLGEVNHLRDAGVAAIARRAAGELRAPDQITPFAVEGLVLELLTMAARVRSADSTAGRPPRWLTEARAVLHDRSAEQLRVADVAGLVGVHPGQLARAFRRHFGTPIGSYARGLRVSWAAGRLRDCDDGIAQIAQDAGFSDQSHFTRTFKRQFGVTPLAYRRAARL